MPSSRSPLEAPPRSILSTAAAFAFVAPFTGCMVHSVDEAPAAPVELPGRYAAAEASAPRADRPDAGRFWAEFRDPELAALVEAALQQNLGLREAWARVEQAHAIARIAGAALYPTLDAEIRASYGQTVISFPGPGGETVTDTRRGAQYSASLPASWELDVWGRIRSGRNAARQDVLAARFDLEAAAMTLASSVTEQWLNVLEQRATRRLLEEQRRTNDAFRELLLLRFRQGQAQASEVLQQEQQVQGLDAQIEQALGQEDVATQQLALLVGRPPRGALVAPGREALPPMPPLPPSGLPAELLRMRPDVAAAERRVVAADYRVGEAIAARFPALRLSASIGLQATDLAELFEGFVWSIAGSATQSLLDGGRRAAEVDRTRAVLEERLASYGQALLRAAVEVEGALAQERRQREAIERLEEQVATASRALDAARLRYREGLTDFLPVLTALRSLHQAEQSLLAARRRWLAQRVQIARALGGTWTRGLQKPEPKPAAAPRKEAP